MNAAAEWTSLLIDAALARSYRWLVGEHIGLRLPEVDASRFLGC